MNILYVVLALVIILIALIFLAIKYGKSSERNSNLEAHIDAKNKINKVKRPNSAKEIISFWKKSTGED